MDRLLYSPSPTPLKPHLNRLPHLPRLPRIDPSKLHFPSSTRSEFAGVHSFSSRNENPILSSSSLPISSNTLLSLNDSRDGSVPKPQFHQQIEDFPSGERKVCWEIWLVGVVFGTLLFMKHFVLIEINMLHFCVVWWILCVWSAGLHTDWWVM